VVLERFGRAISGVETVLSSVAALFVFVIMAVVAVDVGMRYFLNAPLSWSYDLISMYLMVGIFFFALSDAAQHNHHISVDILFQYIPVSLRRIFQIIGYVVAIPFFMAIFWLGARQAVGRFQAGDVVSGAIAWPTWPPSAMVALGAGLIVIRLVFRVIALAAAVATGSARAIGTPEHSGDPAGQE